MTETGTVFVHNYWAKVPLLPSKVKVAFPDTQVFYDDLGVEFKLLPTDSKDSNEYYMVKGVRVFVSEELSSFPSTYKVSKDGTYTFHLADVGREVHIRFTTKERKEQSQPEVLNPAVYTPITTVNDPSNSGQNTTVYKVENAVYRIEELVRAGVISSKQALLLLQEAPPARPAPPRGGSGVPALSPVAEFDRLEKLRQNKLRPLGKATEKVQEELKPKRRRMVNLDDD